MITCWRLEISAVGIIGLVLCQKNKILSSQNNNFSDCDHTASTQRSEARSFSVTARNNSRFFSPVPCKLDCSDILQRHCMHSPLPCTIPTDRDLVWVDIHVYLTSCDVCTVPLEYSTLSLLFAQINIKRNHQKSKQIKISLM